MKSQATVCLMSLSAAFAAGCNSAPEAGPERGAYLYENYCAPCHGDAAAGQESIAAPAIAGLPEWYVVRQFDNFQSGVRGTHFDDIEGMRMRPMAKTLKGETDRALVAAYVAGLDAASPPATLQGGDPAKGKALYATCAACHGPDASGNEQLGSPSLLTTDDWYQLGQLKKFKTGVRGAHPDDVFGAQMAPMAATLADEQAMTDVVSYIQSLRQ